MSDSVYKVIELVGTSEESWAVAAKTAISRAGMSLRDLRVAEVIEQDIKVDDNSAVFFRTRLKVSFKYQE